MKIKTICVQKEEDKNGAVLLVFTPVADTKPVAIDKTSGLEISEDDLTATDESGPILLPGRDYNWEAKLTENTEVWDKYPALNFMMKLDNKAKADQYQIGQVVYWESTF